MASKRHKADAQEEPPAPTSPLRADTKTIEGIIITLSNWASRIKSEVISAETAQADFEKLEKALEEAKEEIKAHVEADIAKRYAAIVDLAGKYGARIPGIRMTSVSKTPRAPRKLGEGGSEAAKANAERIVAHLAKNKQTLGKETLVSMLSLNNGEWAAAIKLALDTGRVVRQGERRGAKYSAN